MPSLRSALVSSPYLGVWFWPRSTIRAIVERDPRSRVIALVLVAALIGAIGAQFNPNLAPGRIALIIGAGNVVRPHIPRFVWLLAWPAASVAFLYLAGAIVRWTGGLLGGTANAVEVRAALAWPCVIIIVSTLTYFATGMASPSKLLMALAGGAHYLSRSVWMLGLTVGVPLSVWWFVVLIACIAEVHRFSFWKGLGAWLMAMCLITFVLFIGNMIAAVVMRL